jgi:nucleoside-diphosphate-sugar epimerase
MENNRKKILITGAAGLIGNCLANALADEYEVVGIDNNFRPNSNVNSKKFLLIDSDIKSFVSSNINTYDYIFHFT